MNTIELDVTMTQRDMYRFNLYHIYHGSQGMLSILLAVLLFAVVILQWGDGDVSRQVIYLIAGVAILLYVPLTLWAKVKKQMKTSEVYKQPLHYTFDEQGITTRFGEQSVTMPWLQLYKIVSTRHMVLLYGARSRANVIPRDQIGEQYAALYELARTQVDSYRFKMKKG